MKLIPLTRGQFAKVDDEDFEKFGAVKWHALRTRGKFYAKRTERLPDGSTIDLYLHRVVMGDPTGMKVDHRHHDTLDNRKSNLRICTHAQNLSNRAGHNSNSKSGVRGVCWFKRDSRWHAQIKVNGKRIHLGYFSKIEDAAAVYAKANRKYFGVYGGVL